MKSWIHEISESYVAGRKPVHKDLKENYVSLTEEQRFDLLSENVLAYLEEQLQNAYGFGWNDLSEERKQSLVQKLTFGLLGRRQVPSSRQFGGASPEDRIHDQVDVDDNPDPDNPSAYRFTEDNPAPKATAERGFFGKMRQKLIGASSSDEAKLGQAKTERETGPEYTTGSIKPRTRTIKKERTEFGVRKSPEHWDGGDMRGGHEESGYFPTGKFDEVEQYQDPTTGEWKPGRGAPAKLARKIGSGHGMRLNDQ